METGFLKLVRYGIRKPDDHARYRTRTACDKLGIWKPNWRPQSVNAGVTLRVQAPAPFRLHWSADQWQTVQDTASCPTALGIGFVDIPVPAAQRAPIRFTFFRTDEERWEGRDYKVDVL